MNSAPSACGHRSHRSRCPVLLAVALASVVAVHWPGAARPQDARRPATSAPASAPAPSPPATTPTQPQSAPAAGGGAGQLTRRPRLLKRVQPTYPPEAWRRDVEGDAVLLLWVDEQGKVQMAEVVSSPGHGLDVAALVAAKKLRFSPAEVDGKPAAVKIRFTFRFRKGEKATLARPPPSTMPAAGAAGGSDDRPKGRIKGRVLQRGTGIEIQRAEIYVLDLDRALLTDAQGRFQTEPLSPGGYAITIKIPGYYPFQTLERVEPGQTVTVKYYVEPSRHQRYRTVVWGSEGKSVVGRTTLRDAEIYEIPGTMGDPLRVLMVMPGVTPSMSGISYPIVHGVMPGDTRYEIDGIQVPMLYHLLLGNAVVNPRFTSGLSFFPSGYSVSHGRFPGALIMAESAGDPKHPVTGAEISLISVSAFHARPIGDKLDVFAAARYGTIGLVVEAIVSDAVLSFWDYQTKVSWRVSDRDTLQLIAFGAGNVAGQEEDDGDRHLVEFHFHRLALRWRRALRSGWLRLSSELGYEATNVDESTGDEGAVEENVDLRTASYAYVALRGELSLALHRDVTLRAGGDVYLQNFDFPLPSFLVGAHSADDGLTAGVYVEADWTPWRLTVTPGVRVDHYRYGLDTGPRKTAFDPRLGLGLEVTSWLTAKGSVGMYQGPSRVTLVPDTDEIPLVLGPVPGMIGAGLDRGLSRSVLFGWGLDAKLPWGRLEARANGFYGLLHSAIDYSLMSGSMLTYIPVGDGRDIGIPPTDGRSYGLELTLRMRPGGSLWGWINYTLSRSERDVPVVGTLPFRFDQTHVLNLVASWEVGRHWTLGATVHVNSGRPIDPVRACGGGQFFVTYEECAIRQDELLSDRLPVYWRIDLRIQKREVFKTWWFDFYVDVLNATFNKEVIGYSVDGSTGDIVEETFPVFIPTLGVRGQF